MGRDELGEQRATVKEIKLSFGDDESILKLIALMDAKL